MASALACFAGGKITLLNKWLSSTGHDLQGSYFYSDLHHDLPLFELFEHPVAVDADPQLSKIATQRGWKQISFR